MPSRRRPAAVTWFSLGLLALGVVYWIRMVGGLSAPALELSVPLLYPAITGAVWGLAWCTGAMVFFLGWRWAPRLVLGIGAAFLAWYWFDRLVLVRSAYAHRTIPFSVGLTVLGVLLMAIALRQPSVRRFFGE